MPYMMLMVPTLTAATALATRRGDLTAADSAITVVAIAFCAAVLLGVLFLTAGSAFAAQSSRSLSAAEFIHEPKLSLSAGLRCGRFQRLVMFKLTREREWRDRRGEPEGFTARWGGVFDAYEPRRQWFLAVEMTAGAVTAVLAGVSDAASSNGACGTLQLVSMAVDAAFLLSIVALKPYAVPIERGLALTNAAVTAASSLAGASGFNTSLLTLLQAVLNVLGLLMVAGALISEGCLASYVRRVWLLLMSAVRGRRTPGPPPVTESAAVGPPLDAAGLHESVRRVLSASVRHLPPRPPPTAAEALRSLEDIVLVVCTLQIHQRQEDVAFVGE